MLGESWNKLRNSRAAWNVSFGYLATISLIVRGLLAIPIAVAFLDQEQLGIWAVTSALMSYLVWADLGIGTATGRLIADAVVKRDQSEINAWWSTTRICLFGLGGVVILLGLSFVNPLLDFFDVSTKNYESTKFLFIGAIISVGLGFPLRGAPGLFTAQNRYHLTMISQAVIPWVQLAGFYSFLVLGWGLKAYLGAIVISLITTWIFYTYFIFSGPNRPRFSRDGFEKKRIKRMFNLSGNMTVVGLVDSFLETAPGFIIGSLGSLVMVPLYTISNRMPIMAQNIGKRTLQAFYPGLQSLYVKGNTAVFLSQYRRVLMFVLSVGLFGSSGILLVNPVLVSVLAGSTFYAGSYANIWFALFMVTSIVAGSFRQLLFVSGSMKKHALVAIAKLVSGIGLGVVGWIYWGYVGIAFVFAFLPLFNGIYCYYSGTASCGIDRQKIGQYILPWHILGSMLVVGSAFLQAWMTELFPPMNYLVYGKTISIPSAPPAIVTLIPAILASFIFWRYVRGKV